MGGWSCCAEKAQLRRSALNQANSDVLYGEPLIGPETINTLPDATLAAFRDHGRAAATLMTGMDEAQAYVGALAALGIDLDEVGETLQIEGLRLFAEAYEESGLAPR